LKKENIGYLLLSSLAVLAIVLMLIISPISQDVSYHNFVDSRVFFGIPNFWNVISNFPFVIVAFLGFYNLKAIASSRTQYLVFFLGILLISGGSAYYHLKPNDNTLVWDRLPMTISFMALLSIIISEFINPKTGWLMLMPLVLLGLLSVQYWTYSADLRPYLFIQFYPMLAIPVILIFFNSKFNLTIGYWWLLLAYLLAKIFEHFDNHVYSYFAVSGHTMKHLVSALGLFILFYSFLKREKIT